VRYPPLLFLSPLGTALGRLMRLASGPRALHSLVAIGSRRAFPCRSVVGVVSFRASYSVGRRAVPSVWPPHRGRVPRRLVPILRRATRLGRLPPYALGEVQLLPLSRGLRRACGCPAPRVLSIRLVVVCLAGGVVGLPI
jgi:hypothetical protein